MKKYLVGIGVLSVLLFMSSVKSSHGEGFKPVVQRQKKSVLDEEIWLLPIQAIGQGEDDGLVGACNISTRYIGMDANAVTSEAIDTSPPFSTAFIKLGNNLFKDIRQAGSDDPEVWTFTVKIGSYTDPNLGTYADPNLEGYYPELTWDPNRVTWDPNEISWDPNQIIPAATMGLWFWPVDPNQRELLVDMTAEKTYLTKEEDGEYISSGPSKGRYLYYAIIFESAYITYYRDSDNDLHGDPNVSERFIEQLEGYEGYVTVSDADE